MSSLDGKKFISDTLRTLRQLKDQAEKSFEQIDDKHFFLQPADNSNSIAIIVKHLSGNFKSRWTNFLTSDGEKPDRNRDEEFTIREADTRDYLMKNWSGSWLILLGAVEELTDVDLAKTVTIRGGSLSVPEAILRATHHVAFHVGQIVYLSKLLCGDSWQTLSIAPGKSEEFNKEFACQRKGQ